MKEEFSSLLKARSLRVTPVRLSVLKLFSHGCEPMSAEMIVKRLKDTDMVTVYRTLATFEAEGILTRVDLHKDAVFYERAGHHHHHMVCTSCGKIENFETCDVEHMVSDVLHHSKSFATISQHSFELFGVCIPCSKK
jgi:Fur family transcriptional regulator, ferric uptake regulator